MESTADAPDAAVGSVATDVGDGGTPDAGHDDYHDDEDEVKKDAVLVPVI